MTKQDLDSVPEIDHCALNLMGRQWSQCHRQNGEHSALLQEQQYHLGVTFSKQFHCKFCGEIPVLILFIFHVPEWASFTD
jgi:hypothetical protein